MFTNENTVEQLIIAATHGDTQSMSILYEQFSKPMYGLCLRMLGDRQDAEDVLQNAFVTAFNKLNQLKSSFLFGSWLRRIVVNECLNYRKAVFSFHPLTDNEIKDEIEEDDWFYSIGVEKILEEVKKLPKGYKQVFILFAIEDFSHAEIGELLHITESTSKSQYHKARKLLRQKLFKYKHGNG